MEEIKATDLPKLQGSEKQISWANDIRAIRIRRYNHAVSCDANERKKSEFIGDIDTVRSFMRPFIRKNDDPMYDSIDSARINRLFRFIRLPEFRSRIPYEERLKKACEDMKYRIAYRDRYEDQLNKIIERFFSIAINDWNSLKEDKNRTDKDNYYELIFKYARKNILDSTSASFWIDRR